ncbi:hypothetical protein [Phenylobacterium sp.]|uniref:hypothetical protein n=1 Tax=Phenylobacterium sp. TaxID=1871053 RepID=UPI00398313F4
MKSLLLLAAASTLALGATACSPGSKASQRTELDCPVTQGDLTRTGAAADGRSCSYRTAEGAEVTLQLVSGDANVTLKAIESTLVAATTAQPPTDPVGGDAAAAAATGDAAKDAAKDAAASRPPARTASETEKKVELHVQRESEAMVSNDGGPTTRVDLPGIHITAGENDAKVRIGGLTVDAADDVATVRIRNSVRLKGEAFSREKRGVRATFIYTGKSLPDGYRFVGYEAAGPKVGPLAVAVVKSRSEDGDGGEIYPDVKRLVRKNGGA